MTLCRTVLDFLLIAWKNFICDKIANVYGVNYLQNLVIVLDTVVVPQINCYFFLKCDLWSLLTWDHPPMGA